LQSKSKQKNNLLQQGILKDPQDLMAKMRISYYTEVKISIMALKAFHWQ
jgi:hypothetical protein